MHELDGLIERMARAAQAAIASGELDTVPSLPDLRRFFRNGLKAVPSTAALPGLEAGTMVAVPVEPTEAMIDAGWIDKEDVIPADIWAAMLAAVERPNL